MRIKGQATQGPSSEWWLRGSPHLCLQLCRVAELTTQELGHLGFCCREAGVSIALLFDHVSGCLAL